MRIDIPTRLGRPCAYPHIHVCMKSYVCQFIFSWVSDSCVDAQTHMYEIIFVRIYIPTHLGRLCAHSVCLSHVTYSFVRMCVPMHLRRCPTTHRHDFIYYIHVCLSMLTQPSKMRGNINSHTYNFVHMCVLTHLGRCPTIPTLVCMKSCFIFPHI